MAISSPNSFSNSPRCNLAGVFILPRVVSRGWQSSAESGPLGGLGPVRRPLNLYNVPIIKKLQSSLLGFLPPPKIILKNANHKQI